MEEKLLAFVAKAVNMNEEEIKETLEQDGGLDTLNSKYATHIKSIKDTGYKSAERKINATWESKLATTFGVQSDTKGTELIDEIQEAVEAKTAESSKKAEITEAQIKKHPLYLTLEKQAQEAAKTEADKWQKVLSEKEEAFSQKELFSEVEQNGLSIIDSLKPVLSEDQQKAKAQKSIIIRELQNYKYMKNGNELVLLDKETGERLQNEQGYPIRFEDVVKNLTTQYYDLQVSEPRASTGRKADEETTTPTVTVPKSKDEYVKFLDSDASPEVKKEVMELYHSQS